MGYPDFSGSNAMCTVAALWESGQFGGDEASRKVVLETPGGVTTLHVTCSKGQVTSIASDALPGFVASREARAHVEGWGEVPYCLVAYAVVPGAEIGLDPAHCSVSELERFFTSFFPAVAAETLHHPIRGTMPPLRLALLVGAPGESNEEGADLPVAAYMEPGVICQSPTGTGITALLAWLRHCSTISPGISIRTISPSGNMFVGTLLDDTVIGDCRGVRTRIAGCPRLTGQTRLHFDPDDPRIRRDGLDALLRRGQA